ncbi:MAG: trypsin-like peptidase domain-containing protein [Clostridia bacterium]|nr:trypsin-like peptidase domain-containing protein [Clostridia bacterium]
MSMKKTIISVISGAVAGGMIASVMTLGAVVLIDKEDFLNKPSSYVSYSENDFAMLSGEAENKKEELSVEEIAKRVGPSIVGISCTSIVQSYFGAQQSESGGSGIIIDDKGHIVTNYHVIDGSSKIKVKLTSGNEYEASLVGGDEKTDIAVIKIAANEELHVATIGNSDEVEVGALAVAIGNPLASELFGTVTAGVISGVNRTMTVGQRDMNLIQTDAAISPGNSGGALINKYGEVIGINSVKLVDDAAEGLGFAIPMNEAVPIIQDLMKYGYVKGRPMIGVSVREITRELAYYNNLLVEEGLYIMSVTEGSGAEKAGLQRGDIITKFDGQKVTTATQMNKIRDKHKAGQSVNVTILRGNVEKNVKITLTEDLTGKKK